MTKEQILEDKFTKAIILADCKLYSAVLTFVRQEVSAYISSGILQIRNSWKRFNKIQKQLYDMYKKLEPNAEKIYGCDPDSNIIQLWIEDTDENDNRKIESKNGDAAAANDDEASQAINELIISDEEAKDGLSLEVVKRLLGAVSFGYGFFQICLSFMPPNVLKLIKVFGKMCSYLYFYQFLTKKIIFT
jgi:phosphopantothenoylcysteine synthetase/decarboxylase